MADSHASRGHAAWSASASERLWACPGSLTLNAGLADKESEAAAWGTAAHEVAELCLRTWNDAVHYLGLKVKTKSHEIEVDEEVAECAQVYVDYVRENLGSGQLLVEQKFARGGVPFSRGQNTRTLARSREQEGTVVATVVCVRARQSIFTWVQK